MASLVEAIKTAENFSTGEIRIHIDTHTKGKSARKALQVFKSLKMDKTHDRNAVLFHVNFDEKYLTIIGDKGIHKKVSQVFWDVLHDQITKEFSKGNFFEGLRDAVLETGQELKRYFPTSGTNINELPDEITVS